MGLPLPRCVLIAHLVFALLFILMRLHIFGKSILFHTDCKIEITGNLAAIEENKNRARRRPLQQPITMRFAKPKYIYNRSTSHILYFYWSNVANKKILVTGKVARSDADVTALQPLTPGIEQLQGQESRE